MLTVAPAANASTRNTQPTFTPVSYSATVSGQSVTVKSSVKASRSTAVQQYGVCVRDASGNNYDFPLKSNVTLSTSGTAFTATKNFSAGTYSYYPCLLNNNTWWWTNAKAFTVKGATTTPLVTTPPTTDPVSTAMPVGNLPGWQENYTQDFNTPAALGQVGTVYDNDIRGYDGFSDTSGHGTYAPDKVLTVSDGSLNYNLHTENGKHLVAAPTLNQYKGQTYGRYSVRFRADSTPGYKIAFLLWPSSDQWNEGEIDWPEGNLDSGMMRPASATPGSFNANTGNMNFQPATEIFAPTPATDWHVATTEWTPSGVKWYWDGKLVNSTTTAVPTTNFRWTLQAETELGGAPAPADNVSGKVQVDWAVSYAYNPSTAN